VCAADATISQQGDIMTQVPRDQWDSALREFSARNCGRKTILEIRDPATGVTEEELGYPLQGVSYDPRGDLITLLVGGATAYAPHVSHVMRQPRRVEIVKCRDGRDELLHVADCAGSTTLALL
jgi:hypothetical protein